MVKLGKEDCELMLKVISLVDNEATQMPWEEIKRLRKIKKRIISCKAEGACVTLSCEKIETCTRKTIQSNYKLICVEHPDQCLDNWIRKTPAEWKKEES